VKQSTYPEQLTPPDIDDIHIQGNENFLNSTTTVWNYGNKSFDSSVQLEMQVSKPPFSARTSTLYQLTKNETGFTVLLGNGSITDYTNCTRQFSLYYINLSSPLHEFGITSGDQYAVSFRVVDTDLVNGSKWVAQDLVSGILIPPPQYTFSPPQSLDLKPGEETLVKIGLNSPVALDSQVTVSTPSNPNLKTDFMTSNLTIPKQSTGYLSLRLKVPENASSSNFVLPIIANVSFPKNLQFADFGNSSFRLPETKTQLQPLKFNSSIPISIVPNEPVNFSIPPEVLATIYTIVISTIIGWSIPNIASYISSRKRRRNFLDYITTIDKQYDTQKDSINALKDWLTTYERKMQYALGNGKISESQYDLLKKKIDYYSSDHVNPE
jgi:hypothetical protein